MEIRIQYFGMLAEITGQAEEQLTTANSFTVGLLRQQVEAMYPEMRGRKYKVAVNLQISEDFAPINENAEIALLPPFAGG
jgi:molybdopterin synthase sulfur carrier subunit